MNRDTRPDGEFFVLATLNGFHRVWGNRTADPERVQQCTSLSIETSAPERKGSIEGVIARMPASELPQLDQRESGYDRLKLPISDFNLSESIETDFVYVYQSEMQRRYLANAEHPILQSYIDCVLAGYLQQFGLAGMQAMIDTTRGWDRPVMNDRAVPRYPRAVDVGEELQSSIDELLACTRTPVR